MSDLEWKPISTFPEEDDSEPVLLYVPEKWDTDGMIVGFRSDGEWFHDEVSPDSIEALFGRVTHWAFIEPPSSQAMNKESSE